MGLFALVGVAFASTQVLILTLLLRTTQPGVPRQDHGSAFLCDPGLQLRQHGRRGHSRLVWGAPVAAQVVGFTGITLILVLAVLAPKLRGA